jgi:hypothetical protein
LKLADPVLEWTMNRRHFLKSAATCAAASSLLVRPSLTASAEQTVTTVNLRGSPAEIGRLWGKINAATIHLDMEQHYLKPAKEAGISIPALIARAEKYAEVCRRFAPHWLAETRAVAEAAGVEPDLYLSFTASVYRGLFLGDECTSYTMSSAFTEDGRIFFHKNRDNTLKKQSVFILDGTASGVNKFIAVSDASVIACMMMVNDKGLAGSADVGGLKVGDPAFRGLMNTAVLRHIAERAATCGEALQIVQQFVREGYYAGGAKWGTHWLFVDATGTILEISNNSREVTHTFHTQKVYFSRLPGNAAQKSLEQAKGPVDFATFHQASRDASICLTSSIAGMSVEIDRTHPGVLSRAWVSLPAKALSFPLFMGGSETPPPLLDGTVFETCNRIEGRRTEWERLEGEAFRSQQAGERQVLTLLATQQDEKARSQLDAWVRSRVHDHLAALTS